MDLMDQGDDLFGDVAGSGVDLRTTVRRSLRWEFICGRLLTPPAHPDPSWPAARTGGVGKSKRLHDGMGRS